MFAAETYPKYVFSKLFKNKAYESTFLLGTVLCGAEYYVSEHNRKGVLTMPQMCPNMPSGCSKPDPYPEIHSVRPNPETVKLLMLDYSSSGSEMTALSEYMYQHTVLLREFPEIADKLECIAIAEMNHATLLANAIRALGGDPQYRAEQHNCIHYWSGMDVDYGKLVRDILERDIKGEKAAIVQYRYHASVIPECQVSNLLLRIAMDEEFHVDILTRLLNSLC